MPLSFLLWLIETTQLKLHLCDASANLVVPLQFKVSHSIAHVHKLLQYQI